ncbi:hypothetical protein HER39_07700, partial [Arthrobacter deserti]|nr:hypothetical protein [Arthrobacter deserti]
ELGAGTGGADLLHQRLVPVPVQDDHIDLVDLLALGLGDQVQVLLDRQAQVHQVGRLRAGDQLLHVEHGRRIEHRAALGDGQHREGVVDPLRGQAGAVDRTHGDVAPGALAVARPLGVVQHRGLVLFALADNDDTVEVHGGQEGTHRVHGGAGGGGLVPVADPVPGGNGGSLGHPHQFEGEIPVRLVVFNRQRRAQR